MNIRTYYLYPTLLRITSCKLVNPVSMRGLVNFKILKRRSMLGLFLLLSLWVKSQENPNIIFILADDLGYGDLSCYGAQDIQTPSIDKLAEKGFTFTRAYANSTVCSPSRAAILTGNYPDRVGVPQGQNGCPRTPCRTDPTSNKRGPVGFCRQPLRKAARTFHPHD